MSSQASGREGPMSSERLKENMRSVPSTLHRRVAEHFARKRRATQSRPTRARSATAAAADVHDGSGSAETEQPESADASDAHNVDSPADEPMILFNNDSKTKFNSVSKPKKASVPFNEIYRHTDITSSSTSRPATPFDGQPASAASKRASGFGRHQGRASLGDQNEGIAAAGNEQAVDWSDTSYAQEHPSFQAASGRSYTSRNAMPIAFNPELPAYVLDRIHPCIPLPAKWNAAHDQYIVSLDMDDFAHAAIVRRVKQHYPDLRSECITPGMIDKRLRILDLRVEWQGWKRALDDILEDKLEQEDEHDEITIVRAHNISRARAQQAVLVVDNKGDRNSCVSTGGRSGKITITKRGTTVETVDDPNLTLPVVSSSDEPNRSNRPSKVLVRPPTPGSVATLSRATTPAVPVPPSPHPMPQVVSHQRSMRQLRFADDEPTTAEPIKTRDARGDTTPRSRIPRTISAARSDDTIGVPSVMRTSSGRPVLR